MENAPRTLAAGDGGRPGGPARGRHQVVRQVVDAGHGLAGQGDRPPDHVLQLADVPRPVVV
ncbi:MAG: hypothetical protein ACKONH_06570, partial [Planctomycetia bacterium]